jgi:hypothetical protein
MVKTTLSGPPILRRNPGQIGGYPMGPGCLPDGGHHLAGRRQDRAQHRHLLPGMQDDDEHPAGHALLRVPSVCEVADLTPGDPAGAAKMEVAHQDAGIIGAQEQALAFADGHSARGVADLPRPRPRPPGWLLRMHAIPPLRFVMMRRACSAAGLRQVGHERGHRVSEDGLPQPVANTYGRCPSIAGQLSGVRSP